MTDWIVPPLYRWVEGVWTWGWPPISWVVALLLVFLPITAIASTGWCLRSVELKWRGYLHRKKSTARLSLVRVLNGSDEMAWDVLRVLGAVWLLPATILVWAFELGPLLLLGWLRFDRQQRFLVARLSITDKNKWYEGKWKGWSGSSRPHAIIIVNRTVGPLTVYEEEVHTDQWFIFGIFFLPLWLLFNAVVGYKRNPLERWAKRYAIDKATGKR